jgi:hypothetical protein
MGPLRRPESLAAQLDAMRPGHGLPGSLAAMAFAALLLTAPGLAAQVAGTVYGVVQDVTRNPISGATIVIDDADQGRTRGRTIVSRADGTFAYAALEPGSYLVSVTRRGLSVVQPIPFEAVPGSAMELRITLRLFDDSTVAARTDAGAEAQRLPDENDDGLESVHGLEPFANRTMLDGAANDDALGGVPVGSGSDASPDPDGDPDSAERSSGPANGMGRGRRAGAAVGFSHGGAVREFRLAAGSYSAQRGSAGSSTLALSQSGSEQFHGSGSFRLRSQVLAAHDPLAIATSYADGVVTNTAVKPHDLRLGFGASVSGPVFLPRARVPGLFFLYSLELERRGFPAVSSPSDPNFYALTATQTALLANRGVSSAAVNAGLNYVSSLTGLADRRADQTVHFGRLDWEPKPRFALGLEANFLRWNAPAGLIRSPVVARARASLGNANGSADLVLARISYRTGPNTANNLRVSYVRDLQYETPQTPLAQEPAISPGGLAPEVNIGPNGLLFGTPGSVSRQAYPDEHHFQLAETLTLVRGHHVVDAGADVSFLDDQVATLANAAGTFRYDSGVAKGFAGGLVDFLTDYTFNVGTTPNGGCPSIFAATHLFCFRSFSQSFGGNATRFRTQDWAGFLEDTWRPQPGLSLHAGLRYDYQFLPLPQTPNPTLDALFGSRGATSVFPEDRNNLSPRVSLAWEPFGAGNGIVRAGFGVYFGRVPGGTIRAALTDTAEAATTTRVRIRPSAEVLCPQQPAQGFGYPCTFNAQPPGLVAATTSAILFDKRFRLPMVEQGSLTLEEQLSPDTTVSATYTFNSDRQLPSSTDLNIQPATSTALFQLQGGTGATGVRDGETFRLPIYTTRVSPSFGPVTDIVSDVNATYHGLTLMADSRLHRGLRVHGELTWSKAIDFGQAQSATPRTNGRFDPFAHGYDKGLSSLNYPFALRADAVYEAYVPGGRRWVRAALNGWSVTPVLVARSGRPYSLDLSGGTALPGGHLSLNGSGGAQFLPTVGRNTLRLPATLATDLRAQRDFRAGSRLNVVASAEVFNLFNHRVVASVTQRAFLVGKAVGGVTPLVFQSAEAIATEGLNTQPFATPTGTGTSLNRERQVQVSLRLSF